MAKASAGTTEDKTNKVGLPLKSFRMEEDSIGSKKIPVGAYYGVQSLRAKENFPMTLLPLEPEFIDALAQIKKACAIANADAGGLTKRKARAIEKACDKILKGEFHDQFIVDQIQGGAGTSMNMNANEVIANIAIEILGGKKGDYSLCHPNDDVNRGQSTNDVIPTAGKLTTLKLLHQLDGSLTKLIYALNKKAKEYDNIIKMGRTQLEDAVPIRLGQEFAAYASAVLRGKKRIDFMKKELYQINMGGTAIGTGLNADPTYFRMIAPILAEVANEPVEQARDLIDATQNIDCFSAVSGAVKDLALTLSKIANDLRLLSSGPRTGFGELNLPAKQNGSSIMPGKVNPVIPEVVNQVAFRIVGNDVTISMATEAGQLELNAFEPVAFYSLFESINLLSHAADTFTDNCISGIQANKERCESLVHASVGVITVLNPVIGYQKASEIAKKAMRTGKPVRQLILESGLMKEAELDKVLEPLHMTMPVQKD